MTNLVFFTCPHCTWEYTLIGDPAWPEELVWHYLKRCPNCSKCKRPFLNFFK